MPHGDATSRERQRATLIVQRAAPFAFRLSSYFPTIHVVGERMSEDRKRRFAEALEHWAMMLGDLRARERAEAIAQVVQLEKTRISRAYHASALEKHHAGKHWK
ncbi:hypothetical protein GT93_12360 [Pseudomonas plecoglossicida]|nr:hypothetical protein GT93_12360 [Pseudomonas plecoglossicida]